MDFSIVICTHNRADELDRSLDCLARLEVSAGAEWELMVVDNRSTDSTREVCGRYEGKVPLRYLYEERQGKSFALNRGIGEARGELILLTDDDVDVTPEWAAAMLDAAKRDASAGFFGGKVFSRWQREPPGWFVENIGMIRSNPRVDLGDETRRFARGNEPLLIGANLAIRKRLFDEGLSFREDLGPSGGGESCRRADPEEFDWQRRALDAGHEGVYVPEAVVYHRDPPGRTTEKYIRHWYTESGRNRVLKGEVPPGREWLGAPRYLWKECVVNGVAYLCTRWIGPSNRWLSAECRFCVAWGSIKECRATAQRGKGGAASRISKALQWRWNLLIRRAKGLLARMGGGVFIALHWPWPMRKPYMRAALTVQGPGGGLGDELMCLPIFDEIKRRNPGCRITFITRRPDFFRGRRNVDEVVKEAPGQRGLKLVYDYVVPPPRPLMTIMAECVGIQGRFPQIPPLEVNPSRKLKGMLDSLPRPLVVVQPLASGWTTNKNWPLDSWLECVRKLTTKCQVVEVGTKPVLPPEELGGHFTSAAGLTNLDDLAYIISQADLFIGPSSSGMHLANAYGVAALIIFGGYEAPSGYDYANVHPIYSPVPCAPCWRQTCPYELKCLQAIKPETVAQQALGLIERGNDKQ